MRPARNAAPDLRAWLDAFVHEQGFLSRYPYYAHVDRPFGPAAVADQHLAGILMWSTSMALGVAWLVVAAYQWLEDEERRTRRQEREDSRLAPGARRGATANWTSTTSSES